MHLSVVFQIRFIFVHRSPAFLVHLCDKNAASIAPSEKQKSIPQTMPCKKRPFLYRLLFATRSNSSFFLMAYELLLPLAALINSSAKHSATDLMLRKAASRAPIVRRAIAWLTRRRGETSTAWRRTVPADPIRVESSRGPQLTIASTATWIGFWSVMMWICEIFYQYPVLQLFMRQDVRSRKRGQQCEQP